MSILDHAPGARPALVDGPSGAALTFDELRATAQALVDPLGTERRLVLLMMGNNLFSVLAYAGLVQAGHPVVLVDPRITVERLAALIETFRPAWVAGPSDTAGQLKEAGVAVVQDLPADGGALVRLDDAEHPALHPDLAVLLTTSGTTGNRKLVRLSRSNVESNARSIADALGLTADERPITSLPLHYSFGLSVLNSHWAVGASIVVSDHSVLQPRFWSQVEEHGCTSLAGVPFIFQLLERTGFRTKDLGPLTTLQQAGGALDRTLTQAYAEHMAAHGGRLVVMYGQTEATARMAYVPPERLVGKIGTAGVAIPGGAFEIDAAGHDGPDGEVVYRGPNVMMGYAESADDLALGDELGGVLRTGDLGRLDDDGFLFLTGRSARIAKIFGLRLNLDDVERELREKGPAAALGGDDVVWGFCAYGTTGSLSDDAYRIAKKYGIHPKSFHLTRVDEIPTTSSGKIDYEQVRRWTT